MFFSRHEAQESRGPSPHTPLGRCPHPESAPAASPAPAAAGPCGQRRGGAWQEMALLNLHAVWRDPPHPRCKLSGSHLKGCRFPVIQFTAAISQRSGWYQHGGRVRSVPCMAGAWRSETLKTCRVDVHSVLCPQNHQLHQQPRFRGQVGSRQCEQWAPPLPV